MPALSETRCDESISAGKVVLEARELSPGRSLASMYEPNMMAVPLIKAHSVLDRVMDEVLAGRK